MKTFKFKDEEDTIVFSSRQIINAKEPILYVSHDIEDGSWQFHNGCNVDFEQAVIVSLHEIVELDNSISQLANLPLGWIAIRESIDDEWIRMPNEY